MASTSGSKFPSSSSKLIPSAPPPPSSIGEYFPYDVFLSFRGKDTRNNFTGHLYDRLEMAGIRTFMDDPEFRKGIVISYQLSKAIQESKTFIVVFSENYASSRWCLDELVNIIRQLTYPFDHQSRILLPVFYDVKPSDVRGINGSFEEAFRQIEANYTNQPDLVKSWRSALRSAANHSGFELKSSVLGSASRSVSQIVKEVLSLVRPKKLFVAKYPIGLDSRVHDVHSLLSHESNFHAQFIGISGMGGSGKTVIAKALYNNLLISFYFSCFVANVREKSQPPNGLVQLQEKLISRLLKWDDVNVDNVDEGIEIIKERLRHTKVLIVLDDIDKLSQVDALAGHRDWFGPGSIIIITTRDQHLLNQVQVDARYEPKELNYLESLKLFRWHSFKKEKLEEPYFQIADEIISYCCGLPLALEVLGSLLFGRTKQQWRSEFEKLQQIPRMEIHDVLKISYDGLDSHEREIFLDIAFFFIGMDIDYVTEILIGCGFSTEIGFGILKDRCLLTTDINNELRMHDLLRDMGREIIRNQYPREPGKRSRLWSHQEATNVLKRNKGTEAIEGITLVPPIEEEIHLNTENFVRMHSLRLLKIDNVNLNGGFEHLSKDIRWISWCGCSLEHLPSGFEMPDLVVLDMQHSRMNTVSFKFSVTLKILNLSHSKCLTSTPDFTKIPSLLLLILEGCTSLVQIDPSIGCLDSLLVLNLKGCEKITNIPDEICSLKLLGYLYLSGCSNLKELPRFLGNIESLRELYADETAITRLPYSFHGLKNLSSLSLRGCIQMSGNVTEPITVLGYMQKILSPESKSLRRLNLRDCNLSDKHFPYNIGELSALQELDLAGNSLSKLPPSFRKLINLESLWLDNWIILLSLSGLPYNLETLVVKNINAYTFQIATKS